MTLQPANGGFHLRTASGMFLSYQGCSGELLVDTWGAAGRNQWFRILRDGFRWTLDTELPCAARYVEVDCAGGAVRRGAAGTASQHLPLARCAGCKEGRAEANTVTARYSWTQKAL